MKEPMPNQAIVFFVVSGLGWIIDVCLTTFLVSIDFSPFTNSCIGAGSAVTFVYVISRLIVFRDSETERSYDFMRYAIWQVCAITAASLLVASSADLLTAPATRFTTVLSDGYGWQTYDGRALATGASKILITPLTLSANSVIMRWLTQRG